MVAIETERRSDIVNILEFAECERRRVRHQAPYQSCDICVYCGSDGSCLAIRVSTLRACSAGTASCGKIGEVRRGFIEAAVLEQGYQASEVGGFLGCHASNVSRSLQKRGSKL